MKQIFWRRSTTVNRIWSLLFSISYEEIPDPQESHVKVREAGTTGMVTKSEKKNTTFLTLNIIRVELHPLFNHFK